MHDRILALPILSMYYYPPAKVDLQEGIECIDLTRNKVAHLEIWQQ